MKLYLYMAISANGMIADKYDNTPWSDEEWDAYYKFAKQFDCIIVGRRTYELMLEDNQFKDTPVVMVLSKKKHENDERFYFYNKPSDVLKNALKHSKVLIAGGGQINALFMDYIDEIYLDVEPHIFGEGIKLFEGMKKNYKIELLGVKKLSKNLVQLHYKVRR